MCVCVCVCVCERERERERELLSSPYLPALSSDCLSFSLLKSTLVLVMEGSSATLLTR